MDRKEESDDEEEESDNKEADAVVTGRRVGTRESRGSGKSGRRGSVVTAGGGRGKSRYDGTGCGKEVKGTKTGAAGAEGTRAAGAQKARGTASCCCCCLNGCSFRRLKYEQGKHEEGEDDDEEAERRTGVGFGN